MSVAAKNNDTWEVISPAPKVAAKGNSVNSDTPYDDEVTKAHIKALNKAVPDSDFDEYVVKSGPAW